jgi:GcrA cell cycle regulator
MEWNSEAIDTLRSLWAEGHSTAEIGRRMGVSKNAVVGKAHRLDLPARPSPIRREAETAGSRPATPPARRPLAPREPQPLRRLEPATPPAPPAPPVQMAPAPAVVRSFPRVSTRSCCWPLGEPGTSEFRFCGGEAIPGKPYCTSHASVAYVKARDRREDAA